MKVLVIVAHPDDEVLGCGGTIARLANEGHEVSIAIMGEGITSRYDIRESAEGNLLRELRSNAKKASNILGAKELFTFSFPDNRFDSVNLLEIIKETEKIIEQVHPQVIYTHHSGDLNIDHSITCRAVLTATRPFGNYPVMELYSFEVPSATDWSFNQLAPRFNPNMFVNISNTLEFKTKALNAYEGEARQFPHPRSAEMLRVMSRKWGATVGVEAAEAFELIRLIKP